MANVSDAIIVGAGISGLVSALYLLENHGVSNITILEARGRVGGRLQVDRGVDVGGAWCWTSAHREVPALARRFGIRPFPQYDEGIHVIDYGAGKPVARTRQPLDSPKVRFEGGAAALTDALADHVRAQGVNVVLDCVVNRISTANVEAVVVEGLQEGEQRNWKAGAVFMAIPPRLVLPPLISWEPSLPTELAEAAKATPTWMGETTKVLVTYPRPFWREQGFSGNGMGYGAGPIQQLYDSCGPDNAGPYALCGFIFGAGVELPNDDVLRPQVMMQLERMFGEGAKSALTCSSHRWGDQPLTSGNGGGKGGGHDDMGSPELRKPFGSASAGETPRVWLSAAETHAQHSGLMEGALLAGKRVAEQAIRSGVLAAKRATEITGTPTTCASGEDRP